MNKRAFGKTGIEIPEIGMGCWAIGGVGYGPVSETDALETLQAAWEGGVRLFDTADTYGEGTSEKRVAAFLKTKQRNEYFLATKAGWDFYPSALWKRASGQVTATGHRKNFDPDYLRFACEQSLQRLGMNYIDLYQLHNPSLEVLKAGKAFDVLLELKKNGKIRYAGVSLHTVSEALWALENLPLDSIQVIYNILDQRMRYEVFPLALQKGVAVIAREPLASGLLTGKYQADVVFPKDDHRRRYSGLKLSADTVKVEKIKATLGVLPLIESSLRFVLSESAVSCVIPGVKNRTQAETNFVSTKNVVLPGVLSVEWKRLFDMDSSFKKDLLPADK